MASHDGSQQLGFRFRQLRDFQLVKMCIMQACSLDRLLKKVDRSGVSKDGERSRPRPARMAANFVLVMAALRSRCGHYIFTLWFPSFSFLQRAQCSHCKRCISYSNSVRLSVCLSVCLSICLSVTCRYCVKTTARSTVQFAPLDSKMCLVL